MSCERDILAIALLLHATFHRINRKKLDIFQVRESACRDLCTQIDLRQTWDWLSGSRPAESVGF